MIFDVIEDRLIASGDFTPGKDLFRNFMGADCQIGVLIRGPLTGISIDPTIDGWHKGRIQIIVRHTDPVLGQQLMKKVTKLVTFEGDKVFPANDERGELRLLLFFPETLPIQFPRLEGNAIEWSVHFKTVFSVDPEWYREAN